MSNPSQIGKVDHNHRSSHSEDDDEESLSLCDLPLLSTGSDQKERKQHGIGEQSESETVKNEAAGGDFDFDFGLLVASLDALESEMCAADDVFFGGRILPFRHSVSSAATASNTTSTSAVTRSNSMDRIVGIGLQSSSTASSSRSSSTRSNSINSSSSTGKLPQLANSNLNRPPFKVRNQFHSFPSPKPYARAGNAPRTSINTTTTAASNSNHKSRSALWEIFRLGLVRTPEIELEDLKVRYNKNVMSRNSSSGGSCSGEEERWRISVGNKKRKSRRRKGGAMSLMSSCKCSVGAVEPGKKAVGVIGKEEEEDKERRRKQDVSRHHRTFEWLKDLSQPVLLNDNHVSTT